MIDESSDDSSDDYFSYKNTAKRAFEIAKKKIAAVKPSATKAFIDDSSSDSDDNSKPQGKALTMTSRRMKRLKRTVVNNRGTRKRLKKSGPKVLGSGSSSQGDKDLDVYSTDINSEEESRGFHAAVASSGLTFKLADNLSVDPSDILDSDEVKSDASSGAVIALSDSSDVEQLTSSEITVLPKDEEVNDANELVSIKISWKLQPIQKFQLRRHQKFKELMEHFSKLEGVPLQKIVIYGGKNNCRLIEPYDTPDTVGVSVTDIFEGGVMVEGSELRGQRSRGLAELQGSGIMVRVQPEGSRSFPVMIGECQRLQVLLVKVAEQMEVAVDKVRLSFDGTVVDCNSTAEELGMEEGDVLDLHLL